MPDTVEARLSRLLLLVPYVIRTPGVSVAELCQRFSVKRSQLLSDLSTLQFCGLPGYGPGDLIEADTDGTHVWIRMADYLSKPVRLTPTEGLLLYSGARALSAADGGYDALDRALEKLAGALGKDVLERVSVGFEESGDLGEVRRALEQRRRIRLVYYSHSKEEVTERDVDPWAVLVAGGHWYLIGWCHRVDAERIFRMDRVKSAEMLDETSAVPDNLDLSRYEELYVQSSDAIEVTLELSPRAAWVKEYYPLISAEQIEDGWSRIKLSAGGTAWLERLLLRLGPESRVISPKELQLAVQEKARELLRIYRSDDPSGEIL